MTERLVKPKIVHFSPPRNGHLGFGEFTWSILWDKPNGALIFASSFAEACKYLFGKPEPVVEHETVQ